MSRRVSTSVSVVLEALLVVIVAAGFAFAANRVSSRGLVLTRNYFPNGSNKTMAPARLAPVLKTTNAPLSEADQRLKEKGLQPISLAEVTRLFHDPGYRQGQIIFVDARNEEEYKEAHIPGAWQLNPYHPERQLSEVLPACQAANQVVVYCTGGECEDADSTAILLRDAGIGATNLWVYGGGFDDWSAQHRGIEHGARNSGDIATPK